MEKILKRSPHFARHLENEPKGLFDFAGWEMPTHFSSLEEEVRACRSTAILFDGHAMGEFHIQGKDALKAVQKLCANDISRAQLGKCVYSSLCTEDGGIFDDLVVFVFSENHFLLTVAAFNVWKAGAWLARQTREFDVCILDQSAGTTCLEFHGPKSREILQSVADFDLSNDALPYYHFMHGKVGGIDCLAARLGVTGELGYEIFYNPGYAYRMYDLLLQTGRSHGMQLCGNRSIGVMRLEKVYHVYTREIDESVNPYEAGLDRTVKLDKGEFIGRSALARVSAAGIRRKLVGFTAGKGAPVVPPKSSVLIDGKPIGHVTFMAASPTLNETIGLAYVSTEYSGIGTQLELRLDSATIPVKVVRIPFFDPEGTRLRG